jgi:hypothetical protein
MKEVDPKIKSLFPWLLFLLLAVVLLLASTQVHSEEDGYACYGAGQSEAMSSGLPPCDQLKATLCDRVRAFLSTHTEAEARAEAEARHIPNWIIRRAERCVR